MYIIPCNKTEPNVYNSCNKIEPDVYNYSPPCSAAGTAQWPFDPPAEQFRLDTE